MTEYENVKYGIVDETTPVNTQLTAHYKKYFISKSSKFLNIY